MRGALFIVAIDWPVHKTISNRYFRGENWAICLKHSLAAAWTELIITVYHTYHLPCLVEWLILKASVKFLRYVFCRILLWRPTARAATSQPRRRSLRTWRSRCLRPRSSRLQPDILRSGRSRTRSSKLFCDLKLRIILSYLGEMLVSSFSERGWAFALWPWDSFRRPLPEIRFYWLFV